MLINLSLLQISSVESKFEIKKTVHCLHISVIRASIYIISIILEKPLC